MSQSAFNAALLDPALPAPKGVMNPDGRGATKRFDVYRNNVAVSLSDALEAAFPVIRKLVGDTFFRAMAGVYLRAHPPTSPLMMFYGEAMPGFLEGFGPARSLPYLPDVARLELAVRHAYHGADSTRLDGDALSRTAPDALGTLCFGFAPTVHLVRSASPVASIWRANMLGENSGKAAEAALVTRPGFDPEVDVLTPAQGAAVASLMAGEMLAEAAAQCSDIGPVLATLLRRSALISMFPKKD